MKEKRNIIYSLIISFYTNNSVNQNDVFSSVSYLHQIERKNNRIENWTLDRIVSNYTIDGNIKYFKTILFFDSIAAYKYVENVRRNYRVS